MFTTILQTLKKLYTYRLFRWALWSILGIFLFDRLTLLLISQFDMLPTKPTIFPHQDIPESQLPVLGELLYTTSVFKHILVPVLLPEHSSPSDISHYKALLTSLETHPDISRLISEETRLWQILSLVTRNHASRISGNPSPLHPEAGVPLSPAEQDLYTPDLLSRLKALENHFSSARLDPIIDTWDPRYLSPIPPLSSPYVPLELSDAQTSEAQVLASSLLRKRNRTLSYLKKNHPKPMGWAPLTPTAWENTLQRDIDAGNLHGREEWKPIYRSWELETVPFDYLEEGVTKEEHSRALEESLEGYDVVKERGERQKEYLTQLNGEERGGEA